MNGKRYILRTRKEEQRGEREGCGAEKGKKHGAAIKGGNWEMERTEESR